MPDGEKWTGKGSKHRIEGAEARKRYDDNMRAIYGTRVKIPPPGLEREDLIRAVNEWIDNDGEQCCVCMEEEETCAHCRVNDVLRALEELEG